MPLSVQFLLAIDQEVSVRFLIDAEFTGDVEAGWVLKSAGRIGCEINLGLTDRDFEPVAVRANAYHDMTHWLVLHFGGSRVEDWQGGVELPWRDGRKEITKRFGSVQELLQFVWQSGVDEDAAWERDRKSEPEFAHAY